MFAATGVTRDRRSDEVPAEGRKRPTGTLCLKGLRLQVAALQHVDERRHGGIALQATFPDEDIEFAAVAITAAPVAQPTRCGLQRHVKHAKVEVLRIELDVAVDGGDVRHTAFEELAESFAVEDHRAREAETRIALPSGVPDLFDDSQVRYRREPAEPQDR